MRMDSKIIFLLLGLVASEAGMALHQLHQVREDVSALRAQVDIILKKEDLFGSLYPSNSDGRSGLTPSLVVQREHSGPRPYPPNPRPSGELFGASYCRPWRPSKPGWYRSRLGRGYGRESRTPSRAPVA